MSKPRRVIPMKQTPARPMMMELKTFMRPSKTSQDVRPIRLEGTRSQSPARPFSHYQQNHQAEVDNSLMKTISSQLDREQIRELQLKNI